MPLSGLGGAFGFSLSFFGHSRKPGTLGLRGFDCFSLLLDHAFQTVDFSGKVLAGKQRGLELINFPEKQIPVFLDKEIISQEQFEADNEFNYLIGLPLTAPDTASMFAVGSHVSPDETEGAVIGQEDVEVEIGRPAQIPFRQGFSKGRSPKYQRAGGLAA